MRTHKHFSDIWSYYKIYAKKRYLVQNKRHHTEYCVAISPPSNIQRLKRVPPDNCVRTIWWKQRSYRDLIVWLFKNPFTRCSLTESHQMRGTQLNWDPWTFLKVDIRQYSPSTFPTSSKTNEKIPKTKQKTTHYRKSATVIKQMHTFSIQTRKQLKLKTKREHSLSVSPLWPIGWALTGQHSK